MISTSKFLILFRKFEIDYIIEFHSIFFILRVYLYLEISDQSLMEIVTNIFDNFFKQLKRDRTSSFSNLIQLFETVIVHYRMKMEKKKEKKT